MEILKKLKSRKFLITLWSVALITFIVISGRAEFVGIAEKLLIIPIAYLPVNAWQKKIFNDKLKI